MDSAKKEQRDEQRDEQRMKKQMSKDETRLNNRSLQRSTPRKKYVCHLQGHVLNNHDVFQDFCPHVCNNPPVTWYMGQQKNRWTGQEILQVWMSEPPLLLPSSKQFYLEGHFKKETVERHRQRHCTPTSSCFVEHGAAMRRRYGGAGDSWHWPSWAEMGEHASSSAMLRCGKGMERPSKTGIDNPWAKLCSNFNYSLIQ